MNIKWVEISKLKDNTECSFCKREIEENGKKIVIQYVAFGRGDDDVINLHKYCLKQRDGENHIQYATRLLKILL